ncbi:MAG: hypothetical protein RLZZ537_595 [Pseudomonadota bacterium]
MSTPTRAPAQIFLILAALAMMAIMAMLISGQNAEAPLLSLFLVGSLLGIALYHSVFGFTAAFRLLLAEQRSAGFRAQMVMLGSACLLFFPALAGGSLFGQPVQGFVSPAGLSVVIGSFLFGIGMQLGGGCASGTLFTVGGGSTRMLVTLLFFILGAMLGLTHLAWWKTLPALPPASMIDLMGWPAALLLNLSVFALAYFAAARIERRRHGAVEPIANQGNASWLRGPWPLLAGALALALLNFTTLYLAGRPWGVTSAFALWGGSALQLVGLPVGNWSGFDTPAMQTALAAGPLGDITSVMDFGIVLGALLAAGMAGKFLPVWRIPLSHLLASIIGGLLLGYGSRIAYGCNIGAFFSGIASGSLHGWVWIVFALIGNRAGIALRPLFKL